MSIVFLILGGNRGNSREIFSSAVRMIEDRIGTIESLSGFYRSAAWGFTSDPFINQAIRVSTHLTPEAVLAECLHIELLHGRTRSGTGYEARSLDIDLLYFDQRIIRTESLEIPHPRIAMRKFVLVPLAEIAPEWPDPASGLTVSQLLTRCSDPAEVEHLLD
ncbi:MAG: 2-amino-4-hydroxy-6-hydroxymethyldihydropteridine diphosphokinase [Marinilabiliales bacterium]|nr:2-amino-4-hydroxy-6-hydroxymethyldihydropteridine diphosphokinase [Marinilabiliales bacterium]